MSWRHISEDDIYNYSAYIEKKMKEKHINGARKYKSFEKGFQGDPLNELEEELLDSLFYVWMARLERENLKKSL